ncbi:doublecortin domain-containing protein 2C [Puma concolor]|uniref:Doublecortin domain-containing protein 2C n=1 Tax=Puma concolor TaxID=9696 RepID=A0A6P6I815_PUMCO|nr:doublecortin domain-containing protein 2C [Puma concolor]
MAGAASGGGPDIQTGQAGRPNRRPWGTPSTAVPAVLEQIKPVVHCDLNVPSRWQTFQRTSRLVNVFTNGRLFIPPVKIIIPKFSLTEWNSVLAMIGEKVFPLGGVQKLFTMNGHLLDNSKDLQDNHFYVAAGPETFKYFPYWKSSKVPREVQRKYADIEKYSREKKKEDSKGKETHKHDSIPRKERDSVFYARAGKKKTLVEPSFQRGSEGDVFRAQTPSADTREAPEVKEDSSLQVEVPVDQTPAEIVTEDEEIHDNPSDFESIQEKEDEGSYEDNGRKLPLAPNGSRGIFDVSVTLVTVQGREVKFKEMLRCAQVTAHQRIYVPTLACGLLARDIPLLLIGSLSPLASVTVCDKVHQSFFDGGEGAKKERK